MMHRLWRYDVFRYAQNDIAPLRVTMMRCLPQCARRHTSLGEAVIIGIANIICRRQTSLKKDQVTSDLVFFLSRGYEKDIFVVL